MNLYLKVIPFLYNNYAYLVISKIWNGGSIMNRILYDILCTLTLICNVRVEYEESAFCIYRENGTVSNIRFILHRGNGIQMDYIILFILHLSSFGKRKNFIKKFFF